MLIDMSSRKAGDSNLAFPMVFPCLTAAHGLRTGNVGSCSTLLEHVGLASIGSHPNQA